MVSEVLQIIGYHLILSIGSVLGPRLLIYINDLHNEIKYTKVYHFADDTNILQIEKSLRKKQKRQCQYRPKIII